MIQKIKNFTSYFLSDRLKDRIYELSSGRAEEYIFRQLHHRGYDPGHIIDVGAYEGEWSKSIAEIFTDCEFILVEPLPSKQQDLRSIRLKNKTIYSEVLSDSSGKKVTFYEMETGSSYYPENTDVDRTKRKRITRTLDELTKSHQLENALLKIDAQGAELDILDGSTTALNSVSAIYLETSLVEYNQDAPLAREVIEYLGDKGYMISDVGTRHRRDGQLIQIDLLFLDEELNVQEKWRSL